MGRVRRNDTEEAGRLWKKTETIVKRAERGPGWKTGWFSDLKSDPGPARSLPERPRGKGDVGEPPAGE
jgi:hypothetical protein